MENFEGEYIGKFSCVFQLLNISEINPNYVVNDARVHLKFKHIDSNKYSVDGMLDMSSVISDQNAKTLNVTGNAIYDDKSENLIMTFFGTLEFTPPLVPVFVSIYVNTSDIKISSHKKSVKSLRGGMKFEGVSIGGVGTIGCGLMSIKRVKHC